MNLATLREAFKMALKVEMELQKGNMRKHEQAVEVKTISTSTMEYLGKYVNNIVGTIWRKRDTTMTKIVDMEYNNG
jgi:hypothetical protein